MDHRAQGFPRYLHTDAIPHLWPKALSAVLHHPDGIPPKGMRDRLLRHLPLPGPPWMWWWGAWAAGVPQARWAELLPPGGPSLSPWDIHAHAERLPPTLRAAWTHQALATPVEARVLRECTSVDQFLGSLRLPLPLPSSWRGPVSDDEPLAAHELPSALLGLRLGRASWDIPTSGRSSWLTTLLSELVHALPGPLVREATWAGLGPMLVRNHHTLSHELLTAFHPPDTEAFLSALNTQPAAEWPRAAAAWSIPWTAVLAREETWWIPDLPPSWIPGTPMGPLAVALAARLNLDPDQPHHRELASQAVGHPDPTLSTVALRIVGG